MNDSFYELFSLFEHNLIRKIHHGEVSHDSFGVVSMVLRAQQIKISSKEQLKVTFKVVLYEIASRRKRLGKERQFPALDEAVSVSQCPRYFLNCD